LIQGVAVGFLIRNNDEGPDNMVSSRIQMNGSPLIARHAKERERILSALILRSKELAEEKQSVMECRNSADPSGDLKIWLYHGFSYSDHLNLIKEISGPDQLWHELGENRRRQIKQAEREHTQVHPAKTKKQVTELYQILETLYRVKVKKTLPPLNFFHDFFTHCQKSGNGVILVATKEDRVIGGIVCPILEKRCMYEWYVCGLDKEFPRNHPSVMVTWHALLYASRLGIARFDFMGLGKPGIPYGVRDFKLRFGGTVVNYGRFTKEFSGI